MTTDQLKEDYFNTLFEKQVTRHEHSTNKSFVSTRILCNNPALSSLFQKLYQKYKVKESYSDFTSECIYWTYVAIQRFEIKDNGSWQGIIQGTDKANTGRLIANIKHTVTHEVYRYVNAGAIFTRGEVDGVKGQHVTLKFEISSLDAVLASDSEDGSLADLIKESQNFFQSIDLSEYQISYFARWFKENKERILEPSQLIFLTKLERARKVDGYTINDTEEVMGMTNSSINSRLRRLKNRVASFYLKENVNGHLNRLQMAVADEMELWAPVIDLVESEDLEHQNDRISDWILQNIETEKVANMLYDHISHQQSLELTAEIKKSCSGGKIPSSILYIFIQEVEKRIETLKNTDTTVTPVTKPSNGKHIAYEAKKKAWDNQPIIVTDLEGNFLREESPKRTKPKMNIQLVLPTGARLPI